MEGGGLAGQESRSAALVVATGKEPRCSANSQTTRSERSYLKAQTVAETRPTEVSMQGHGKVIQSSLWNITQFCALSTDSRKQARLAIRLDSLIRYTHGRVSPWRSLRTWRKRSIGGKTALFILPASNRPMLPHLTISTSSRRYQNPTQKPVRFQAGTSPSTKAAAFSRRSI